MTSDAAPSESDLSRSDYSATLKEQNRRSCCRGEDSENHTSDSNTTDEERHTPARRNRPGEVHPGNPGQLQSRWINKGKGRAHSPAPGVEQSGSATGHKKPGPFSDAAKECIAIFADETMAIADQLAAEFGKTRHDILAQAGLGSVRPTRALNSWNVFCKWYSAHYPKADSSM